MKKNHHYDVISNVQNQPGVLARITILLRKFNVNIQSINVKHPDKEKKFTQIHFTIDSKKNIKKISLVMKKLECLIPVIEVRYKEIKPD
ncbi:ACT domain-containing protein [Candidatus Peregrinibacteria bacterium]|nr:ACT domain-containing protein [Candidatus Peregrinibacteria bacterium]